MRNESSVAAPDGRLAVLEPSAAPCALCFWLECDVEPKRGHTSSIVGRGGGRSARESVFLCEAHQAWEELGSSYDADELRAARDALQAFLERQPDGLAEEAGGRLRLGLQLAAPLGEDEAERAAEILEEALGAVHGALSAAAENDPACLEVELSGREYVRLAHAVLCGALSTHGVFDYGGVRVAPAYEGEIELDAPRGTEPASSFLPMEFMVSGAVESPLPEPPEEELRSIAVRAIEHLLSAVRSVPGEDACLIGIEVLQAPVAQGLPVLLPQTSTPLPMETRRGLVERIHAALRNVDPRGRQVIAKLGRDRYGVLLPQTAALLAKESLAQVQTALFESPYFFDEKGAARTRLVARTTLMHIRPGEQRGAPQIVLELERSLARRRWNLRLEELLSEVDEPGEGEIGALLMRIARAAGDLEPALRGGAGARVLFESRLLLRACVECLSYIGYSTGIGVEDAAATASAREQLGRRVHHLMVQLVSGMPDAAD